MFLDDIDISNLYNSHCPVKIEQSNNYSPAPFETVHALQPVSVQTREALQVETVLLGKFCYTMSFTDLGCLTWSRFVTFRLNLIFSTAPAASKTKALLKSRQN